MYTVYKNILIAVAVQGLQTNSWHMENQINAQHSYADKGQGHLTQGRSTL